MNCKDNATVSLPEALSEISISFLKIKKTKTQAIVELERVDLTLSNDLQAVFHHRTQTKPSWHLLI